MAAPARERIVEFTAGDGFRCNLIHVTGRARPPHGVRLCWCMAPACGPTFSARRFSTTIVDYLIDRGYDVWLENWRASIDFAPNKWTLDQAALFDHPEADQDGRA